jgi:hypothetical protein
MATSEVQICNIALQMLGANPITSLTEGSQRASLCNEFYGPARDATLRDHEWNFAQVRVNLVKEVETPAWGFDFQYQLPTSPYCLRVNEPDPIEAEWTVESNADGSGRKLLSDTDGIGIRYTARITDVNLYTPLFVMALAANLAAMMALPLTEDSRQMQLMETKYRALLSEAKSMDSQEGSPKPAGPHAEVLLAVRRHGANAAWWNRSKNSFGF